MSSHSWEDPAYGQAAAPAAAGYLWEADAYGPSDSDDDQASEAERAADQFLEEMVSLYLESVLSARMFCILCYHAAKAGMAGSRVEEYGMKPGAHSGNYQKHLDAKLGLGEEKARLYWLKVPCSKKGSVEKSTMRMALKPVHELVESSVEANPALPDLLAEAKAKGSLPPCYDHHPVVRSSPAPVLPFALYMDGLQYSLVDTVIGIWLVNLLTGARQVIGLVRKRILCACGCRGRDTFFAIMAWLRWSLRVAASGYHPMMRHDGAPFEGDALRQEVAGSPLRMRSAILFMKGDWAEFCERFGFPTSAHALRPCFCCSVSPGDAMYDPAGISLSVQPWVANTDADFERAFLRCERRVVLTPELHREILQILFYDRRRGGANGRALARDLPDAGLLAGDRLEPCDSLPDPGDFELITVFPTTVVFWRSSETSLAHFRSPFWDVDLGLTPTSIPAIDLMHTLYLGPMLVWSMRVLWLFLDANIWGSNSPTDYEGKLICLSVIKIALERFYSEYDAVHPGHPCTRLSDLTPKMVGLGAARRLKTKAMETYYLLLFFIEFMPSHLAALGADAAAFLEAGKQLRDLVGYLKSQPERLTPGMISHCLDLWKRYSALTQDLDMSTPKAHLMWHLILRAEIQGNPWSYTTFMDESLNKLLKKTLRLCHQAAFETMGLAKINQLFERRGRQRVS